MKKRWVGVLGVSAVSIAAIGLLAPSASAEDQWKVLAPGLGCGALICRNDSNHTYRVDWVAHCANVQLPDSLVPAHTWVGPHEMVAMTAVTCPVVHLPGSWVQDAPDRIGRHTYVYPSPRWVEGGYQRGVVASGQYNRAVVDNSGHPVSPPAQPLFPGSA
jgi:hypothetical protein